MTKKNINNCNENDVTFLTCIDSYYNNFVLPFCYFANNSNPGCNIEIFAKNLEHIDQEKLPENANLYSLPTGEADTLRYILSPKKQTKYTYITDIDILHTEKVIPFHLDIMHTYNTTFSNIVRTNKKNRLSGLHFVETEKWYNDTQTARKKANVNGQDENELYKITKITYPNFQIPQGLWARPVHGIHCSLGRQNIYDPSLGWELNSQRLEFFKKVLNESPDFGEWFNNKVTKRII